MKTQKIKDISPYVILLFFGFLFFPSSGRDDVHITYWAAYTLSNFGEIVNYNGVPVEQSSSLLYTLILAGLNYISNINIVQIGTFVSIFFGLSTIYLTGTLSRLVNQNKFFPQIIAATSVPLIYWSFGALETTIVSTVVLLLIITATNFSTSLTIRNYLLALFSILLYLLVRPEAVFIISCFLFVSTVIFFFQKERYAPFVYLIATTVLLFFIIVVFRINYFGSIFPQPVVAKMGSTPLLTKVIPGVTYYLKSFIQYPLFLFLAIPIVFYLTKRFKEVMRNRPLVVIFSLIFAYAAFVIFAGGDWMEGARFFVPIIAPAIVVATLFYLHFVGLKKAIIIGVSLNVLFLFYFAFKFSTSYPIFYYKDYAKSMPVSEKFSFFETVNRIHYRDMPLIVELRHVLTQMESHDIHPTIMSVQAGMVPYHIFKDFYKRARFIDFVGLSTRDFTKCDITNSLPKGTTGISMTYKYFFSNIDSIKKRCDIITPDIIYDLDSEDQVRLKDLLATSEYTLVYLQTGFVANDHDKISNYGVRGTEFIVVKAELASKLKLETKRYSFK